MGLTIHYSLTTDITDATNVAAVRAVVQKIHASAQALPFSFVSGLLECEGDACNYENSDDENRWLKIQAGRYCTSGEHFVKVAPLHLIAFTAVPGEGCEPANFGLCRYPAFVEVTAPSRRRIATELQGWSWKSFCKTQYASNPARGGTANFMRCHLAVIALLDSIQKQELAKVEVNDESGFWQDRDLRKLAGTVGQWNETIAALVGQFKDAIGGPVHAPITQFADFEHLEAKANKRPEPS